MFLFSSVIGRIFPLTDTSLKKRRLVGVLLILVILAAFLSLNRFPKIDTIDSDLAIVASPDSQCFQGFCIEDLEQRSLLERWWDFSLEYLRNVSIGMLFAFVMAGLTEAFIFPPDKRERFIGSGFKGVVKGVLIGPVVNLCSACIVPIANGFRRTGSGLETTVAITQSSSTLNLLALVMAAIAFAPTISVTRISLSLAGALLLGPLVAWVSRSSASSGAQDDAFGDIPNLIEIPDESGWFETLYTASLQFVRATFGYFIRLGPIMLVAGFGSGFVIQWISPQTVTTWIGDDILGVLVAATIGVFINVPLMFEIPLVAAMLLAGMGTAPAGAILFTAAAGGPITFWGLSKVMPKRGVFTLFFATWCLGVLGGLILLFVTSIIEEDRNFTFREDYDNRTRENVNFDFREPLYPNRPTNLRFTDVTLDSGIISKHMVTDVVEGRTEPRDMIAGAVAEDFDGDGWIDIFILTGEGPAFLYMNDKNSGFVEEGTKRGVSLVENLKVSAAAADYDNDNDVDIVVTYEDLSPTLLRNDGKGYFTPDFNLFSQPEKLSTSPSWGDVDNDGLLELVVGEWNSSRAEEYDFFSNQSSELGAIPAGDGDLRKPRLRSDSKIGKDILAPVFMYKNLGDGQMQSYEFRKGKEIDLWVFAPRFADMNGDGLIDLAVVSDFNSSKVYLNVGDGMFELDVSATRSLTDENGMGSAIADYDNDGDLDWFISSIFGQHDPIKDSHAGTGNRFYRNDVGFQLTDVTGESGVRRGGWGWAASFGDFDNDGDLDLYHANGWIQDEEEGDPLEFHNESNKLFENVEDGQFQEVGVQSGAGLKSQARGVIVFDYDNDGDLDIFVTNNQEYVEKSGMLQRNPAGPTLLRNDTINENHWIKVMLEGRGTHHTHGIGARIYVTTDGVTQLRELHASTNYASQEPGRVAHFGIGESSLVEEIRVEWPNGEVSVETQVSVDRLISILSP